MLEADLQNRIYSGAFYAAALLAFLSSLAFHSIYLAALTAVLLLASALYFHSGHIVNSLLIKHAKIIEVYNGYKISGNLCSAVKRAGGAYHSVSCVLLRASGQERDGEIINTLVSNTDFPFEFSLGLERIDSGKVLDWLEERRARKEIEMSRCDPKKQERVSSLKRELAVIEGEIRDIRGQKMLSLRMRLKTFASAASEFEASRESLRNAEQLANEFSSSLALDYEMLKGEGLLDALSLEGAR